MPVAEMAGVKQLAMIHHDPEHNDDFLLRMEKLCQGRFPNTQFARERMEIVLYNPKSPAQADVKY